jgi:hypothetical protein
MKILGPNKDEVTEEFSILHNEFYDLYRSPTILRIVNSMRITMELTCG